MPSPATGHNLPGKAPHSAPTCSIADFCADKNKVFTTLALKDVKKLLGKSTYPVVFDLSEAMFDLENDQFCLNCPDVVKEMYLENNSIVVANSFSHFSKLQVLVLDNNKLSTVSLKGLVSLVHFSARHNEISQLKDVPELKKLTYMDVSDNKLHTIVDNWKKVKNLKVLNISRNPLGESSSEAPITRVETLLKNISSSIKGLEYFSANAIPKVEQSEVIRFVLTHFKKLQYYCWTKITKKNKETKTMVIDKEIEPCYPKKKSSQQEQPAPEPEATSNPVKDELDCLLDSISTKNDDPKDIPSPTNMPSTPSLRASQEYAITSSQSVGPMNQSELDKQLDAVLDFSDDEDESISITSGKTSPLPDETSIEAKDPQAKQAKEEQALIEAERKRIEEERENALLTRSTSALFKDLEVNPTDDFTSPRPRVVEKSRTPDSLELDELISSIEKELPQSLTSPSSQPAAQKSPVAAATLTTPSTLPSGSQSPKEDKELFTLNGNRQGDRLGVTASSSGTVCSPKQSPHTFPSKVTGSPVLSGHDSKRADKSIGVAATNGAAEDKDADDEIYKFLSAELDRAQNEIATQPSPRTNTEESPAHKTPASATAPFSAKQSEAKDNIEAKEEGRELASESGDEGNDGTKDQIEMLIEEESRKQEREKAESERKKAERKRDEEQANIVLRRRTTNRAQNSWEGEIDNPQVATTSTTEEPSGEPWLIGLDELQLEDIIGDGVLGESYIASEIRGHRAVVKTLRPQNTTPEAVSSLVEEIKKVYQLSSRSLCPYIGVCIDDTICVVSEYQEGHVPLSKLLADPKTPLSVTDKFTIAMNILMGIIYLHTNNLTFGILKSEDILVNTSDMSVKLTSYTLLSHKASIMRLGVAFDPAYIAPEIFFSSNKTESMFTKPADVFSFGAIVWELFEGGFPHFQPCYHDILCQRELKRDKMDARARAAPRCLPFSPECFKHTPSVFIDIIKRSLSFLPDDRPSLQEWGTAFKALQRSTVAESKDGLSQENRVSLDKTNTIITKIIEHIQTPNGDTIAKGLKIAVQLIKEERALKIFINSPLMNAIVTSPLANRHEQFIEGTLELFSAAAADADFCTTLVNKYNGYRFLARYLISQNDIIKMRTLNTVNKLVSHKELITSDFIDNNYLNVVTTCIKSPETPMPQLMNAFSILTHAACSPAARAKTTALLDISNVVQLIQSADISIRCEGIKLLGMYLLDPHPGLAKIAAVLEKFLSVSNARLVQAAVKALDVCCTSGIFIGAANSPRLIDTLSKMFSQYRFETSQEKYFARLANALSELCIDDDCCSICRKWNVLSKCNNALKVSCGPVSAATIKVVELMKKLFEYEVCCEELDECGGAQHLISTLCRCTDSPKSATVVLEALSLLSNHSLWATRFAEERSIQLFAMQFLSAVHSGDDERIAPCVHILKNICGTSSTAAGLFAKQRVLDSLSDVMNNESKTDSSSDTLEDASHIILAVLCNPEARPDVPMGSINMLFEQLGDNDLSTDLAEKVLHFIIDVLKDDDGVEILLSTGCISELVRYLLESEEFINLGLQVCYALLKTGDERVKAEFKKNNAADAFDRISTAFSGNTKVIAEKLKERI